MRNTRAAARAEGAILDEGSPAIPIKPIESTTTHAKRTVMGEISHNPVKPAEPEASNNQTEKKARKKNTKRNAQKKARLSRHGENPQEVIREQLSEFLQGSPTVSDGASTIIPLMINEASELATPDKAEHEMPPNKPLRDVKFSEIMKDEGSVYEAIVTDEPSALATLMSIAELNRGITEAEEKLQQLFRSTSNAPIETKPGSTLSDITTKTSPQSTELPAHSKAIDEDSATAQDLHLSPQVLVAVAQSAQPVGSATIDIFDNPDTVGASKPEEPTVLAVRDNQEERIKRRTTIASLKIPPPVSKSKKALTKSTFHLPSDETAARLKLQREERMQRREQAEAQNNTKARPKAGSKSTKPTLTKPTASSMVKGKAVASLDGPSSKPVGAASKPRMSTMTQTLPSAVSKVVSTRLPAQTVSLSKPITAIKPFNRPTRQSLHSVGTDFHTIRKTVPARASLSLANQRTHVKDVFNRGKVDVEEQQRLTRDNAEVMSRTREEASKNHRLSGRAWAATHRNSIVASSKPSAKENAKPVVTAWR